MVQVYKYLDGGTRTIYPLELCWYGGIGVWEACQSVNLGAHIFSPKSWYNIEFPNYINGSNLVGPMSWVDVVVPWEFVMKPAHKNIEKIDQRLIIQPLRGGNLLYITQMNDSLMIQMKKTSFLYIGV